MARVVTRTGLLDLTTARGFVAAGLGVAVVPATGDDPLPASTGGPRLVRITDAAAARDVGLVWSTERALLPAAALFRRYLLAHVPRPQVPDVPGVPARSWVPDSRDE